MDLIEIQSSINIAEIMQIAVTPVFLLAGIGALLSVMVIRLGRIKDGMRVLQKELVNIEGNDRQILKKAG